MRALYDKICTNYDTTRRADPVIVKRLNTLLHQSNNGKYIDLACGTGNYTIELRKFGGKWTGADVSEKMIESALKKDNKIQWVKCSAECLPFKDDEFNGAICTLAIHHFRNIKYVFSEVSRVISKGQFIIFTALPSQVKNYWLKEYFPNAIEQSAYQLPTFDDISNQLKKNGFMIGSIEPFFVTADLIDFFLYSGKHKPEIYLSKKVRNGISTFCNLASTDEINNGLHRLSHDIESGYIQDVINKCSLDKGDYLFIQATKV